MAASRLPGKPLLDVAGLPLVERVRRRACLARGVDRVLVATEDPAIAEVVRSFGGEVALTGPARNGTHRVALAVGEAEVAVINVQGDMPLVDPQQIERVVGLLQAGASIATLSAPWPDGAPPSQRALVKVGPGPTFTRDPIASPRLHVGIYGFGVGQVALAAAAPSSARSRSEDLEQLAWLDAGLSVEVAEVDFATPGVDTPEQLAAVRAALGG